jgi:hypothetical protein
MRINSRRKGEKFPRERGRTVKFNTQKEISKCFETKSIGRFANEADTHLSNRGERDVLEFCGRGLHSYVCLIALLLMF